MKHTFAALLAGLLFGVGLTISGMVNPAKVLGFLDIAGAWDPSLLLVMGGALLVALPGFRYALAQEKPLCATNFLTPTNTQIDSKLLAGSALFGIGWGVAGLCPGPAIANLALAPLMGHSSEILIFLAAMIIGMLAHKMSGA